MKCNLHTVTLTGADDTTNIEQLIGLSKDFPFVEWGILIGSCGGVPRFPSKNWMLQLADAVAESAFPVQLSVHVCGRYLDGMKEGSFDLHAGERINNDTADLPFMRSQLNFHGELTLEEELENVCDAMLHDWAAKEIIIQLDGVNDRALDRLRLAGFTHVSGLYDTSHGCGVGPDSWPAPNPAWNVGYAGGLGPDNLGVQLTLIAQSAGDQPFWIDMETKLRSSIGNRDAFDLTKCEKVLTDVRPHVVCDAKPMVS